MIASTNGDVKSQRNGKHTSGQHESRQSFEKSKRPSPNGHAATVDTPPLKEEDAGKLLPFPTDVLPKVLQAIVRSSASALPCPEDFVGCMVLPVLGAFVGRKRCVEIKAGWWEYPLLWLAVIARSGDRKSPAFDKATEPLRRKQVQLKTLYEMRKKSHASLSEEERKGKPPLKMGQIQTTDSTVEALKGILTVNPDGVIYAADELSALVRGIGQYKGGHGNDLQHWLSIWNGSQIVCNRKGSPEPIIIDGPFVAAMGGLQPDLIDEVIADGKEDGYASRFLLSWPDPLPPADWNEATVGGAKEYAEVCEALWRLKAQEEPVRLSAEAKKHWVEWVDKHRKGTCPNDLRPAFSKAEGYSLRLALILFLTRQAAGETDEKEIDLPSVEGAVALIEYFKSHARRVYERKDEAKMDRKVKRFIEWVTRQLAKAASNGITVEIDDRLMVANGVCKTSDDARGLIIAAVSQGYGAWKQETGRKNVVFYLGE